MTGNQSLDSLSSSLSNLMMNLNFDAVITVILILIAAFQLFSAYEAFKRLNLRAERMLSTDKKTLLHRCIDTKGQRVVSIERLAKELGVEAPSKEEIERIVEGRK